MPKITRSYLAQIPGPIIEITLTPPIKQTEKDIIKIGGKIKSCKELNSDYSCEEKMEVPVYTASKSDIVLKTFKNLLNTFDIYFEIVDSDTNMFLNNVKIKVKYIPAIRDEEFRVGTYKNCFKCFFVSKKEIEECINKCSISEEKIFTDKNKFNNILKMVFWEHIFILWKQRDITKSQIILLNQMNYINFIRLGCRLKTMISMILGKMHQNFVINIFVQF